MQQVLLKEQGGTNTDILGVSKQKIWQKTYLFLPNFKHLMYFFEILWANQFIYFQIIFKEVEDPMELNILYLNCDIETGISLFQRGENRFKMLDV